MPCINAPNPTSPYGQLKVFKEYIGQYHLFLFWAGSRDWDFTAAPQTFVMAPARTIVDCFLYWNVIGAKNQDASNVILNGNAIKGTEIGWSGNTAWSKTAADGDTPADWAASNIINKVYRANVTPYVVPGSMTYNFTIVGNKPDPTINVPASDSPHYPGCNGSQGFVFVFVLNDPCPSINQASFKNSNLYGESRIILYDGAVGLTPAPDIPFIGGVSSYNLNVDPGNHTEGALFITGVGDAQTTYPDSLAWNGVPFPGVAGSYWNPNAGSGPNVKLLAVNFEGAALDTNPCPPPTLTGPLSLNQRGYTVAAHNVATGSTTGDALCWFLAIYKGHLPACTYTPQELAGDAPKDNLSFFKGFIGSYAGIFQGIGIRDFNTNINPAIFNVSAPGPIIKAYLYWNMICGAAVDFSKAIINGIPITGCFIGWCGNTCWKGFNQCEGVPPVSINPSTTNQLTINKAYRADVTSIVAGGGTYGISIPGQQVGPCVAATSSDMPTLPNCYSGQGIVLILIYQFPDYITHGPSCCPGQDKTSILRTQILIYDGCVLLTPSPQGGYSGGGFPVYNVPVTTQFNTNIEILTGVGDAQTKFKDNLYWDGVPFATNPYGSYFNPNVGKLLHLKKEIIGGKHPCDCKPVNHVATATTSDDCLAWFLFIYYGEATFANSSMTVKKSGGGKIPSPCRKT